MSAEMACAALNAGSRLELRYDGLVRIVEVHAVGTSKKGDVIMRVWQVQGGSVGGTSVGWKLLRMDEAAELKISEDASEAPREAVSYTHLRAHETKANL